MNYRYLRSFSHRVHSFWFSANRTNITTANLTLKGTILLCYEPRFGSYKNKMADVGCIRQSQKSAPKIHLTKYLK